MGAACFMRFDEFKMAESSKIIQFKTKKEIFDQVSSRLACSDCKAVPKDVPIFQTGQGDVLCSICKPKSKLTGIFRSYVLEDLLKSLPISCKYQKNKCPVVVQDREHLSYHEEDCKFRDVLCPYNFCEGRIPAIELKKHFQEKHKILDLEKTSIFITEMAENGVVKVKDMMVQNWQNFIWLQLVGSQFEAKNFEYSLKVEDPDVGKFSYEGTVRSLDDDKNEFLKMV